MKLSIAWLGVVLLPGLFGEAKLHGMNAFKRGEKPSEKHHAETVAAPQQPQLRKRDSSFYTNKTKRESMSACPKEKRH